MPNSLVLVMLLAAGQAAPNSAVSSDVDADRLVRVLYEWEQAVAQSPQLLPNAFADQSAIYSAHELETARELCGPISARRMIRSYRWTCADSSDGAVQLTGYPRDAALRLFVNGVRLDLDRRSFRPQTLSFRNADGTWDRSLPLADLDAAPPASLIMQTSAVIPAAPEFAAPAAHSLNAILSRWESAAGNVAAADLSFQRIDFSKSRGEATRQTGRFCFLGADRGVYTLSSTDEQAPPVTHAECRTIVWDAPHAYLIDPATESYDIIHLPEDLLSEDRTVGSWDRRLAAYAFPHLGWAVAHHSHLSKVIDGCRWTLVSDDSHQIILEARPTNETLMREFDRLSVVLDRNTWQVRATTQLLPSGDRVVHIVTQRADHATADAARMDWHPDLNELAQRPPPPLAPPASPAE